MDGLLIIDKPAGPTSHDVVARVRRVLGERRVGHTGTLDPMATGVLALVLGRATRLARFLSASDKSYEATIRLGVATDTGDAIGAPLAPPFAGVLPSRNAVDAALEAFRGTFLQQPPMYSAKKIDGKRSHRLARDASRSSARQLSSTGAGAPPAPQPGDPAPPARTDADASTFDKAQVDPEALEGSPQTARHATPARLPRWGPRDGRGRVLPEKTQVTLYRLDLVGLVSDRVTLTLDCSAGFYVRSLAHDLGEALGTGAHLERLRRTRSGAFTLEHAIALDVAEQYPDRAIEAVVPLSGMLPALRTLVLTPLGVRRAINGCDLGPADSDNPLGFESQIPNPESRLVRLLDPTGELVGIAEPARAPGLLHPFVILM